MYLRTFTLQCFLGFEWIYAFFGNFGNLFSDETRKTLRTGAVPTLNLPVKNHASKQSDDLHPRKYLTLNVDDIAKPTVPSVCKPCFKNVGDFIKHIDSLKLSGWTRSTKEDNSSIVFSMFDGIHHSTKRQ